MGRLAVSKLMYVLSIIATFLVMIITIIGAFAPYTDPTEYLVMPFVGLIVPGLLIINILLTLYWLIRWKVWTFVPLIAILANIEYATAIFQFSFDEEIPNKETLKVASYNIHSFNNEITGYSAKQIEQYMSNEGVDVICFQEFGHNVDFNLDSIINAYHRYPYKAIPILPGNHLQTAIFSKYPIINNKVIPFPGTFNCGMWADIQIKDKTVRIFNVHMQTTNLSQGRSELKKQKSLGNIEGQKYAFTQIAQALKNNFDKRAYQCKMMRAEMDTTPLPMLLCGDFNDSPSSYCYQKLKGNLKDGFKTCGNGYEYTYRYLKGILRIDYIFHSPELKGLTYDSHFAEWSDHNSVLMKVAL